MAGSNKGVRRKAKIKAKSKKERARKAGLLKVVKPGGRMKRVGLRRR